MMKACTIPENMPPLFEHYSGQKWGGGVCSNIQLSCMCVPSSVSRNLMHEVNNHDNCQGFLEEWQIR